MPKPATESTFAGAYFLLAGYVYADAVRRGMPPIPWTALAVLVPNCVGFVLYFLLRKPILHPCPSCGRGVAPDAAFCPRCGQPQMNLGPQPSREEPSDLGARTCVAERRIYMKQTDMLTTASLLTIAG